MALFWRSFACMTQKSRVSVTLDARSSCWKTLDARRSSHLDTLIGQQCLDTRRSHWKTLDVRSFGAPGDP